MLFGMVIVQLLFDQHAKFIKLERVMAKWNKVSLLVPKHINYICLVYIPLYIDGKIGVWPTGSVKARRTLITFARKIDIDFNPKN